MNYIVARLMSRVESKLIIELGMGIGPQDCQMMLSSDRLIRLWLGRYDLCRANPDIHPPSKARASQRASTVGQSAGTVSKVSHEVRYGVEGEFGEVNGQNCVGCSGLWGNLDM